MKDCCWWQRLVSGSVSPVIDGTLSVLICFCQTNKEKGKLLRLGVRFLLFFKLLLCHVRSGGGGGGGDAASGAASVVLRPRFGPGGGGGSVFQPAGDQFFHWWMSYSMEALLETYNSELLKYFHFMPHHPSTSSCNRTYLTVNGNSYRHSDQVISSVHVCFINTLRPVKKLQ